MPPERYVIGVDVGGTKLAAALLRGRLPAPGGRTLDEVEKPEIVDRSVTPTDASSPEATLRGLESCIARLAHDASRVEGIGVGVASMVDFSAGRIVESVNLPLADVPIRDVLQRRFGVPVVVDNDAAAAAIGEWVYGAGVGANDMIMLTLGTGVGGGVITGGRPLRGASGAAGELGHIIVEIDGLTCPGNCPSWGCLEAYAAGPAMAAAALLAAEREPASALGRALAAGDTVDGRLVTRLALDGDPGSVAVLARAGQYLGAGMVTLSNVFDPELFVVGGGAAAAGDLLLDPARRVLAARALPPARDRVRVVPAVLGPDAGYIGAAALALTELFPADSEA